MSEKTIMEQMQEIIQRLDRVECNAYLIYCQAIKDGEPHKTAIRKCADFFSQSGRDKTAEEILEYGKQWELSHG